MDNNPFKDYIEGYLYIMAWACLLWCVMTFLVITFPLVLLALTLGYIWRMIWDLRTH
jgi:hypothetical protein